MKKEKTFIYPLPNQGGRDENNVDSFTAEMFNAAINGFDLIPITIPNPSTAYSCACLIMNDTVIVTGGIYNGVATYDVYAYHVTSGTWTMEPRKYTIDPWDDKNVPVQHAK